MGLLDGLLFGVATILVGIGVALSLATNATPMELLGARGSFILASAIFAGLSVYWTYISDSLSLVVRLAFGALAGAIVVPMLIIALLWVRTRQAPTPGETVTAKAPTFPRSIRVEYSSRQILQISSMPGDYNRTLNLDNVAALRLMPPFNRDGLTLSWFPSPPVTIAEPQVGKPYNVPSGGTVRAGGPGVEVKGLTMTGPPLVSIGFDIAHPVQLICVGERIFRVSLESVKDKANATAKIVMFFEYEFAISEEAPTAENRTDAISLETPPSTPRPSQSPEVEKLVSAMRELPVGTIEMQLQALVNGQPNFVRLIGGTKSFFFDPIAGEAVVHMATNADKSINLRLPLITPAPNGRYYIAFVWDNSKGARLHVNDKYISDGL
jgi:hypothetical protein